MSKWKWIAQDQNGDIFKYAKESEPKCILIAFVSDDGEKKKLVEKGKQNQNFKETLINLETEDYEINDGILTRIPRKTKLDKLIDNVKKIDKKAAKWMNKNRNKLSNTYYLDVCFDWDDCEKYDWLYIHDELIKLEQDPEPAKETLKYRVGLYIDDGKKYLSLATNAENNSLYEKGPGFVRWLTDWMEVKV